MSRRTRNPAAIALRCRKGVAPFVFDQIYLGVPWVQSDGSKSFMIKVDGRTIYAPPILFFPCNPARLPLWPVHQRDVVQASLGAYLDHQRQISGRPGWRKAA